MNPKLLWKRRRDTPAPPSDETVKEAKASMWEYTVQPMQDGGQCNISLNAQFNELGEHEWEFCSWVDEWRWGNEIAPNERLALFKRRKRSE